MRQAAQRFFIATLFGIYSVFLWDFLLYPTHRAAAAAGRRGCETVGPSPPGQPLGPAPPAPVAVRVGQAIGRKDFLGAQRAGNVGMVLGAAFMMVSAICFWSFPRVIISLFLDMERGANAEVVSQAVILLGVAAVFQVCDGIQVTAAGALRGLKDTRTPMFVGVVAYWLVGLGSGYLLGFQFGWGGVGLWWGLVLGLTTAAILLSWRFTRQIDRLLPRP